LRASPQLRNKATLKSLLKDGRPTGSMDAYPDRRNAALPLGGFMKDVVTDSTGE
jgi:hypothetical protein